LKWVGTYFPYFPTLQLGEFSGNIGKYTNIMAEQGSITKFSNGFCYYFRLTRFKKL
jgi:hypothetical protein